MTSRTTGYPRFPVDEIRGRLLHEALLAEATEQVETWSCGIAVTMPPHREPPVFPTVVRTGTGSLRAVVVAS